MGVSKFSTFITKILSPYKFLTRFCSHYGIFGRGATVASVCPTRQAGGGCEKKPPCPPPPSCPPPPPKKPACPPPEPSKPQCPPKAPPPDPCKKKCTSKPEHRNLPYYTRNTCRLRKPPVGRYTLDTRVSLGEPPVASTKTEILLREIRCYCSKVCDKCKKPIAESVACPKCHKKGCKCGQFRDVSDAEKKKIDTYFECYKTKEYYMYGPYSYYDMMSSLSKHRLPQPVVKCTQL